jgi:hypothetical protein
MSVELVIGKDREYPSTSSCTDYASHEEKENSTFAAYRYRHQGSVRVSYNKSYRDIGSYKERATRLKARKSRARKRVRNEQTLKR